jgi:hypothetical protein
VPLLAATVERAQPIASLTHHWGTAVAAVVVVLVLVELALMVVGMAVVLLGLLTVVVVAGVES